MIFTNSYKKYIYLDNNNILHNLGFILNLNNLKITYSTNNHNYIYYNKQKIYFPNLIFKHVHKIKSITKRNIIHLDSNIFNNSFDNLYYEKNKNKNIKYNNFKIHYLVFINKFDKTYNKIKTYNSIKHLNILNKKNFILQLLDNEFVYYDDHFWNLEIKKIELKNLDNYTKLLDNIYYLSNDLSHIINSISNHILQIHIKNNGEHYSNIYIKNNRIIKLKLEYYTNPNFYKQNNLLNNNIFNENENKIVNSEFENNLLNNENENNLCYNNIFNEFENNLLNNENNLLNNNIFNEFENNLLNNNIFNEFENNLCYDNNFNENDCYDLNNTYINILNEFLVNQLDN